MFLALGVVAFCSAALAQVNVNETFGPPANVTITGQVTNVNPNTVLTVGTQITFLASTNILYTYVVTTVPSANPPGLIATIANAINNAFNAAGVGGSMTPGGTAGVFGSNLGEYSVNFLESRPVPFDLGISAVLGAGAIAAVRTARKRRKEQQSIA